MWSMFKPFAHWIDRSPDEGVDEVLAGDGKTLGVVGFVLVCLLVTVFFVCLTWWRGSIFKPVEYLSVESGQQPQSMVTLTTPVYSNQRIQRWVATVVSETLTFNFVNIDERIGNTDAYFSADAAAAMRGSIEAQGIVEAVKKSRLNVTVTPLAKPRLVNFSLVNGVETWVVEAPIIMTYASSSSSETRPLLVSVKIKRVDAAVSPDGLQIIGFYSSNYSY